MIRDLSFAKRAAFYVVDESACHPPTYQRGVAMTFKGRRYPDAEVMLSVLISWYWRCLDSQSVILNGMPAAEAEFLHDAGVLAEPENYGIRLARHEALPDVVALADAINVRLRGAPVKGPCLIGGGTTRYFEGRQP